MRDFRRAALLPIAALCLAAFAPVARSQSLSATVAVQAVILPGVSSIAVSTTNLTWEATIVPGVMDRVNSSIISCEFLAANGPWEIAVYHTNGVGKHALSGVADVGGVIRTNWLPVKVWHPNLGPSDFYADGLQPNPMDAQVWSQHAIWVRDRNNAPAAFLHQIWQVPSPVPFHFIVDASSAYDTLYRGDIVFELIVH